MAGEELERQQLGDGVWTLSEMGPQEGSKAGTSRCNRLPLLVVLRIGWRGLTEAGWPVRRLHPCRAVILEP